MSKTYTNIFGKTKTLHTGKEVKTDAMRAACIEAEKIWHEEWVRQGAEDYGTCTGGKSLRADYFPNGRHKYPKTIRLVNAPPVQGNLSAANSMAPALEYLKAKARELGLAHLDIEYYDGWMD